MKTLIMQELRVSMKVEIKREVERQVQEIRAHLEHQFEIKLQRALEKRRQSSSKKPRIVEVDQDARIMDKRNMSTSD